MSMSARCPECGAAMTDEEADSGGCPACMLELGLDELGTRSAVGPMVTAGEDGARFLPGATVAGRYRIVSLVGRGGMGEIYRADDLRLGQPVALKFLRPTRGAADGVKHLLKEAQLARQVAHPNVCRVYDIGEIEGTPFLSMEYVDGEDLATLLRRVGHVPRERAIQIARQLCAGLAAAHEQGILHRDLKPGNVMIDGRGRAKITDFGLAEIDQQSTGGTISGTPSYMAPEQAARGEVSVRSDVYSLGLVLFELFTGSRVFDAKTPGEMERLQRESTPPTPSNQVDGFDPTVERVIQRCLETDPSARPPSAPAVAAALPGGDALEAALAAGETPLPEVVAAAGGAGTLRPAVALPCLVAALVGIGLVAWWGGRTNVYGRSELKFPPQVMAEKARQIVEELGFLGQAGDEAWQFYTDFDYLNHVRDTDASIDRWDRLRADRPSAMGFWYRSSPDLLVPFATRNHVVFHDPPRNRPGMISLRLDAAGRLVFLSVVPDRRDPPDEGSLTTDWNALLEAAGLDAANLAADVSEWTPPSYCDQRHAWTGAYPDQPEPAIRVEAGSYRGRPVYFEIVHPWTQMTSTDVASVSSSFLATQMLFWGSFAFLAVAAALMARRNVKAGRGDRRSAFRVGAFVVATVFLQWVLAFHHVPSARAELGHGFTAFAFSLFLGFFVWVMYIALEPFARRVWPQLLISWSRLMGGRLRDPIVGKHALFGALFGLLEVAVLGVGEWTSLRLGYPTEVPAGGTFTETLHSVRALFASIVGVLGENLLVDPMLMLFMLVFMRFLLRGRISAMIAFTLVSMAFSLAGLQPWYLALPFSLVAAVLILVAFTRFGLVGAVAFTLTASMNDFFPLTLDTSAWYFSHSLLGLLLPVGVVVYSFWTSLGGQPVIGEGG